jgi:hypothetical protein
MVFIGYSEGAKAYMMLDPGTKRIHTLRDIIFDESRGWRWDLEDDGGSQVAQRDFTIKFFTARAPEVIDDNIGHHGGALSPPPNHDAPQPVTPPLEEQEE